jgi:hypothetical protein
MRGTVKPPKQNGAHPPYGNFQIYLFDGGPRQKSDHFLNNISQTKNSVWGLNRAFFLLSEASKGGKKPPKHAYMREKVKQ